MKDESKVFELLLSILLETTQSEYGFVAMVHYDEEKNPYIKVIFLNKTLNKESDAWMVSLL